MTILSKTQQLFLELFKKSNIADDFYLSGGTALSEFYFHHRLSEDLDFFTNKIISLIEIEKFVEKAKSSLGFSEIEYRKLYDRNVFIFKGHQELKTEFTLYPFKKIGADKNSANLKIDSLDDIAANKLFTILDRQEIKDFVDLFFFFKNKYPLLKLRKLAERKFETKIDPVGLGSVIVGYKKIDFSLVSLLINISKDEWDQIFSAELKTLNIEFINY